MGIFMQVRGSDVAGYNTVSVWSKYRTQGSGSARRMLSLLSLGANARNNCFGADLELAWTVARTRLCR